MDFDTFYQARTTPTIPNQPSRSHSRLVRSEPKWAYLRGQCCEVITYWGDHIWCIRKPHGGATFTHELELDNIL